MLPPVTIDVIDEHGGFTAETSAGTLWRPGKLLRRGTVGKLARFDERSQYQNNRDVTRAVYKVAGYRYPVVVWLDNATRARIGGSWVDDRVPRGGKARGGGGMTRMTKVDARTLEGLGFLHEYPGFWQGYGKDGTTYTLIDYGVGTHEEEDVGDEAGVVPRATQADKDGRAVGGPSFKTTAEFLRWAGRTIRKLRWCQEPGCGAPSQLENVKCHRCGAPFGPGRPTTAPPNWSAS